MLNQHDKLFLQRPQWKYNVHGPLDPIPTKAIFDTKDDIKPDKFHIFLVTLLI